ncbi:RNA polymerase sigma factor [Paenibacillus enshidis]|uniref:RNA polymerase sigma factor n=1 Tax=Paenibacillus enshidis TaxID=1458439 RepID=A0ABV5AZ65_9BACL
MKKKGWLRRPVKGIKTPFSSSFRHISGGFTASPTVIFTVRPMRILMNYCRDELKRRKRWQPLSGGEEGDRAEMISDSKLDLQHALARMKPKYREVLILKYYQDMTIAEIAQVLEKPEGTIKTWLYKGLKQMKGKRLSWQSCLNTCWRLRKRTER